MKLVKSNILSWKAKVTNQDSKKWVDFFILTFYMPTPENGQTHPNNCLSMFDHFVGFELKGLSIDLILDSIVFTGQEKSLDAKWIVLEKYKEKQICWKGKPEP